MDDFFASLRMDAAAYWPDLRMDAAASWPYLRMDAAASWPYLRMEPAAMSIDVRMHAASERWSDDDFEGESNNEISTALEANEVESVNFHCKDQAKRHNTSRFDLVHSKHQPVPVLRRGGSFFVGVRFKRPYNVDIDKLRLELKFGEKNVSSHESSQSLNVTQKEDFDRHESEWDAFVTPKEERDVLICVQIPTTAAVGVWRLKIVTSVNGSSDLSPKSSLKVYECRENIYILFNPWNEDDPVYLENDIWRQEYVLSDLGKLYYGTYLHPGGRPWYFGQFDSVVLPASMYLLQKSGVHFKSRGDPIKITRALSAMINSNDDNGVLHGKWQKPYTRGTQPSAWTGSVEILKRYMKNGGKPVKYGQCWVFSGIFTTVCRALGIPCRSITNFSSAHDTDGNIVIDEYYNANGKLLRKDDTVWNFHVWNECWMTRPDLPQGYGGWQVVDATPQEKSAGIFRTGPASVVAIKRGKVHYMYDAPFVFSEVNADCLTWKKDPASESGWRLTQIETDRIGRLIVTKKVAYNGDGIDDMEDITAEYKGKEGSQEERMTVMNAARRHGGLEHVYKVPLTGAKDVQFVLEDIEKVMIGKPVRMTVKMRNVSSEKRTVSVVLCCSSVYYTGVNVKELKKEQRSFYLKPNQSEQLTIDLDWDDYFDKLVDFSMMKTYALATVSETSQIWSSEDEFRIQKPSLALEVQGHSKKKNRFLLEISFTNPLPRPLQECVMSIAAPGIQRKIELSDVRPGAQVVHREKILLRNYGQQSIIAVFSSSQLTGIYGSKSVVVLED